MVKTYTTHFILYVSNQETSTRFYSELLELKPILNVPGMTEFQLNNHTKLGLMPEKSIAKILMNMPNPALANGIPKCELYLFVNDVKKTFNKAIKLGAKEINLPQERDWGDFVGYVSDFDGNIIAIAEMRCIASPQ